MAEPDHGAYVAQMARQLGIELPEAELARVAFMFGLLARSAAQLREAGVAEETLPAALFRPGDGGGK